ncbi:UDP-glucose dehydrogenase family protein [Mycobacterium arosiense]|uniref:UDP-glucose 6-dehydrogenase n=1 Tax=Mycobacterium arosiense ATCC BAA-1401 = DSM 45069 TaxID=1265311 RepID=A0A1W9ZNM6_MYCAI|nr:UDP-glucose/GDP-mannose dehydrogenase family protein [Mycobacterium arosiense]ORA19414.1 UDP-glucose 6-dehydrogenase [Mycobacterium arosiense ATCC BAA-1401 = DSM 45069]
MSGGPLVGVVGAGYVGLTTAVCVAGQGLNTVAVDADPRRVRQLAAGVSVIDEPGLCELLSDGLARGTLSFSTDFGALADRDVVFVCVPTPSAVDGAADLGAVESVIDGLGGVLRRGAIVALKSTVPVGTTSVMARRLCRRGIRVVSAPEFLREGRAVGDFRHPDRLVIGTDDELAAQLVQQSYGFAARRVLRMSPESAELAKYASNAFLAVKLSYANSLAALSARVGADINDVTCCMGADRRIGPEFLRPGPGWGGSCLPKDTAALVHIAHRHDVSFSEVEAARHTNTGQAQRIVTALRQTIGRPLSGCRITALGLTFKAATSDTRDSPALAACEEFTAVGAQVVGFDPQLPNIDPTVLQQSGVTAVDDPYRAAKAADAIVVLTEWPQFRDLDWQVIAQDAPLAVVIDARNSLDPATVREAGLVYLGNGVPQGF